MPAFKHILCPLDFSEPAHEGLAMAVEMATLFGAELTLIHVVQPVPVAPLPQAAPAFDVVAYENELVDLAKGRTTELTKQHIPPGIRSRTIVVMGEPAHEIVRVAEEEHVDLIVMSTHGESGWHRFVFGSVAEKVVRMSHCATLTVPEPTGSRKSR